MNNNGFKVDFIGIGAPKCGTSWVAMALAEHPKICFSVIKETSFFCGENKWVNNSLLKYNGKNIKQYALFFKKCKNEKIKGEFSVQYLYDQNAARKIKENFPEVKIIAVLRNPVSRFVSDYNFRKYMRKEVKGPIEKTLNKNGPLIEYGMYSEQVKRYFDIFPRKNIKIVIYEEMTKNPVNTLKEIYSFLGADPAFIPKKTLHKKINPTMKVKFRFLMNILHKLRLIIIRMGGAKIIHFMAACRLNRLVMRLNFKRAKMEKIDPETEATLKKIYEEDRIKLEKLIGRKIPEWH